MTGRPGSSGAGDRLLDRLEQFFDRVRDEGVPVGTESALDLGRALEILPLLDRTSVREACRVTLPSSPAELSAVERVFDEFWSADDRPPVPPPSDGGPRPRPRGRRGGGRRLAPPPERLGRDEERERLEGRYSANAPAVAHPLAAVDPEVMRRFRRGARHFRRSVAARPGRRWERSKGGTVDPRRTARAGIRNAGEWVELFHRQRAPRRADLAILWDVSGSMREHTAELAALIYSLQRLVRRTRVFAFAHDLEEVTEVFRGQSYARALPELDRILHRPGGGTRIAHCLGVFRRREGSLVRPTTTVLLVSDGWDLGDGDQLTLELARLSRLARGVAWVNPYAGERGFRPETAALRRALPFLDLLTSPSTFPAQYRLAQGPRPRVPPA